MRSSAIVHPDEISEKLVDRLVDADIEILGIHPIGGSQAHIHVERMLELMKTDQYRHVIDYAYKKGLKVEYEIHAASYLLPRNLFADHPEYFRMDSDGARNPELNFCVSNNDALSLFAHNAALLARSLYRSTDNFYFWLDDGWNSFCSCEKCRELAASDQQTVALNAALRQIKKDIPDAKLAFLAYCETMLPPIAVTPDEDIFLEYAPFAKYTAKGEDAPDKIIKENEMLKPLMKKFGVYSSKLLEYWYDNSLFSGWKKPPKEFTLDKEAMQRDIRTAKETGFEYISTFACFLGEDYEELFGAPDYMPFGRAIKG